jgi:hypothetical protein
MHGLLRRLVHSERKHEGFYRVDLLGQTASDRRLTARVAGEGDAGCEPTAMMLAESALSLARRALARRCAHSGERDGNKLVERERRGGMTIELVGD